MMDNHYIRALAALAALAIATPAGAADFTFDVPVSVENLPSMHTILVSCAVYTAYPGGRIVGTGNSPTVAMSGGSYAGTITVEVNTSGLAPASEARAYGCSLEGLGTARTGVTYRSSPSNFADAYQRATGHMLSRANNTVRGPLP
ncbi:MAG: hypothetical protein ACR2FK_08615 [Sphingomicrobium sp.]